MSVHPGRPGRELLSRGCVVEVRSLLGKTAGDGRTGVVETVLGEPRALEGSGGVWSRKPRRMEESGREADGTAGGPRRWPWWEADLWQPLG